MSQLDLSPSQAASIEAYASGAYLEYAMSIVKGRAIPHFFDGLKPVQRRILFSMHELSLTPAGRYVKSARIVGDVIGKYHPHGDQSVYDAMVRMAQPFSFLHPLVDGQGNFGSLEGDTAAAMRYTEARVSPSAMLLLDEVEQGGVEFAPNYDGERKEPRFLPALLPMLLVNGAAGIGVGMATQIPPHNLIEAARAAALAVKYPTVPLDRILEVMPGPDFPSGGQLVSSPADIRAAYATGRGTLRVRAKWKVEDLARGQWRIAVTGLPHGVSVSQVMVELDALLNPGGDKKPTVAQLKLKAAAASLVDAARDESDRNNPVRLVIEPKTGKIDQETLMAFLLANTSLETTVSVNLVAVDNQGTPRRMALMELLKQWAETRVVLTRKRLEHELTRVLARLHILGGRKLVLLNLDEVIRIIRASDTPKADLMAHFGLSDRQADDILDMRLRQLSGLEAIALDKEIAERRDRESELNTLLGEDALLRGYVVSELGVWAKKHQQPRRTLIKLAAPATAVPLANVVAGTAVAAFITKQGWLRVRPGNTQEAVAARPNDEMLTRVELGPEDTLVLLYASGRAFSVPADKLHPGRDFVPLASLLTPESGDTLLGAWKADGTQLVIYGTEGYGFRCTTKDLIAAKKAGKCFADRAGLRAPLLCPPGAEHVLAKFAGRVLVFPLAEVKELAAGGKGVQLVKLKEGEVLDDLVVPDMSGKLGQGRKAVTIPEFLGSRASRGKPHP